MLANLFAAPAPPIPLVLYSRPGCAASARMRDEIERSPVPWPWSLTEIDVDRDPTLAIEFGAAVPVLWIGGRRAFSGRLTAAEFERKFARLGAEWLRARELSERIRASRERR